ncbi:hypothetical protein KGY64_06570 [Candidatus Bipolaricaulota bacterium]|nr:hypothetical protein [Candidatus Bipolaricaulota bacterium]
MTGAEVAFFDVRDQQKDELVMAAVSAPEELLAEISSAGHVNLVGRRWKPDQGYLEDIKGRKIATFDGLGELVGQSLSPEVSDVLRSTLIQGMWPLSMQPRTTSYSGLYSRHAEWRSD